MPLHAVQPRAQRLCRQFYKEIVPPDPFFEKWAVMAWAG